MSGPHTAGPWEFVPYKEHEDAFRKGEGHMGGFKAASGWVCGFGDSTTYYPSEGTPPSEADARLIAAAPELLEALVKLRDIVQGVLDERREAVAGLMYSFMLQVAEAAIAKATQP